MTIEQLLNDTKNLDEVHLLAGLTVIARNTLRNEDILKDDPAGIGSIVNDVLFEDKAVFHDSPLWLGDPRIPEFAFIGDTIHPDILQGDVIHEWTLNPGRKLFDKFKEKFKDVICGKDGPYEKFCNGLVGQADLPATIVAAIIATGISVTSFWIPLVVYVALLLVKTGLKMYCEV